MAVRVVVGEDEPLIREGIVRVLEAADFEVVAVACDADFTFGLFDLQRRKLVEPTPEWLVSLGLGREEWQPGGAGV